MEINGILKEISVDISPYSGADLAVRSSIDGKEIASLKIDNAAAVEKKIAAGLHAFKEWRDVPAPKRGELIRIFGDQLRKYKEPLAQLVTIECGKIIAEGRGEVQEMIDICDFAVGLSRQLYGLTIASERHNHIMQENWLPLGPIAVISAFNFPAAVWAWNFALAIVCGNPVIWKPSEKTPLTAILCHGIFEKALAEYKTAPENLSALVIGKHEVGEQLVNDERIALVSATGSTRMGRAVGPKIAERFGKSLLELGGNNAIIVSEKADIDLALPAILFGAVGTSGQRCTSTRRLIIQESIYDKFFRQLKTAYESLPGKIGNPLEPETLIGPLIDEGAFAAMQASLAEAKKTADEIVGGGRISGGKFPGGYYVAPALVKISTQTAIVKKETFAPILYAMPYKTLDEALEIHNDVPQGLSSAIFTTDLREAEYFKRYSDCGIANVNIGTSGAEIGGAFGGEKETGGGRESGSDSWKNYMRRQTSTSYFGTEKPELAQGIVFDA